MLSTNATRFSTTKKQKKINKQQQKKTKNKTALQLQKNPSFQPPPSNRTSFRARSTMDESPVPDATPLMGLNVDSKAKQESLFWFVEALWDGLPPIPDEEVRRKQKLTVAFCPMRGVCDPTWVTMCHASNGFLLLFNFFLFLHSYATVFFYFFYFDLGVCTQHRLQAATDITPPSKHTSIPINLGLTTAVDQRAARAIGSLRILQHEIITDVADPTAPCGRVGPAHGPHRPDPRGNPVRRACRPALEENAGCFVWVSALVVCADYFPDAPLLGPPLSHIHLQLEGFKRQQGRPSSADTVH